MKVVDEQLWSSMCSDLTAEETGEQFFKFFTFWFDAADKMVEEDGLTATEAMRAGLFLAESELGFLAVDWVGQMLCVATMHWAHGKSMMAGMSIIEQRVGEEAMARQIAHLQEQAKVTTPPSPADLAAEEGFDHL